MTFVFKRIETAGIAQVSYLLGDDGSGTAIVVDPRPDVEVYLQLARQANLAITHILETHIHADFMSGARELASRLGGAEVCVSGEGEAEYGFAAQKVHDGDLLEIGKTLVTVRHTPGHTPEHIAFEIAQQETPKKPWAVLTGDSLFVGSAGRPDLLDEDQTDELIEKLFHTLYDYYAKLDEAVLILPGHGAGSACGASIGELPMSALGQELRDNKFLQFDKLEEFAHFVKESAPPEPLHYRTLKKINAQGPWVLGGAPPIVPLPPDKFEDALEQGESQLLDARSMLAFGGGHIAQAINIGPEPMLSVWAGQMLNYEQPILLVVEDDTHLDFVLRHLRYTGFTQFTGYLAGGMTAWANSGRAIPRLPQMSVHDLHEQAEEIQILDVRSPQEFEEEHIPGAKHYFVADMHEGVNGVAGLKKKQPLAVYCGSGYRASIAASILHRDGYEQVFNVPGSMQAWQKAGYETAN